MYGENSLSQVTSTDKSEIIRELKRLVGLPIGVNLEPVDLTAQMAEDRITIASGRQATKETFQKANQLGFDFICLTGNPGVGVSNQAIVEAIKEARKSFTGLIIAGKMHGAGVSEPVVDQSVVHQMIAAGADVLLVPAIGTVPGVNEELLQAVIDDAHSQDVLVMSAIGTSQESAEPETIREIALRNKILGVDIQHIGDANMGIYGIENITVLSNAIRGKRHTAARLARSVNR